MFRTRLVLICLGLLAGCASRPTQRDDCFDVSKERCEAVDSYLASGSKYAANPREVAGFDSIVDACIYVNFKNPSEFRSCLLHGGDPQLIQICRYIGVNEVRLSECVLKCTQIEAQRSNDERYDQALACSKHIKSRQTSVRQ